MIAARTCRPWRLVWSGVAVGEASPRRGRETTDAVETRFSETETGFFSILAESLGRFFSLMAHSTRSFSDERRLLSISELTRQLKEFVQTRFTSVWVAGEISDLSRPPSGHVYMTLKDGNAQLKAVLWRSAAAGLDFPITDGREVLCQGEIDIYPPRGTYQLIVRKMELRGEGAAQRALRELQEKLRGEGLFDPAHKKPLPRFPQRIAVVTSPTGAAVHDFLQVARRRWHGAQITVIPARVEGAESVAEVVRGIRLANRASRHFDLLVITRGGGSMESLQSFNNEAVCRAIFASQLPIISAIGHEIDVTLADLVADQRALTPSEAAELAIPAMEELQAGLDHLAGRMASQLEARFDRARMQVQQLASRRVLRHPEDRLHDLSRRLDELHGRSDRAIKQRLVSSKQHCQRLAGQLDSLSPLSVLGRGYSITQRIAPKTPGQDASSVDQDAKHLAETVRDPTDVKPGDTIVSRLAKGSIISRVESSQTTDAS